MQIKIWLACHLCMQAFMLHAAQNNLIEVGVYAPKNQNFSRVTSNLYSKQAEYSPDEEDDQKAAELEYSNSLGELMRSYYTPRRNFPNTNTYSSTELADDDEKKDPDTSNNENDDASSLNGIPNTLNSGLPRVRRIGDVHEELELSLSSQLTNKGDGNSEEKDSENATYTPTAAKKLLKLRKSSLYKRNQSDAYSPSNSDDENSSSTAQNYDTKKKIRPSKYSVSINNSNGQNDFSRKITFSKNSADEADTSSTEDESTEYMLGGYDPIPHPTNAQKKLPLDDISKTPNSTRNKKKVKKSTHTSPFSTLTNELLQRPTSHFEEEDDPTISSDNAGASKKKDTHGNMTMNGLSTLAKFSSAENSVEHKLQEDDSSDDDLSIKTKDIIPYELFKHQANSRPAYKKIIKPVYYQQVMNNRYSVQSQSYTHNTFPNGFRSSMNNLVSNDDILNEKLELLVNDLHRNKATVLKQKKQIRRLKKEVERWKRYCRRTCGTTSAIVFILSGALAYFIILE